LPPAKGALKDDYRPGGTRQPKGEMHTTKINDSTFVHNGGFDGDVTIIRAQGADEITLPFEDVLEFVARYVQQERVSKLEQANAKEILGLT
jgi:hypothetical protein